MASRTISVQILGDSQDLERAFARSAKAAQKFKRDLGGGVRTDTLSKQAADIRGITAAENELIKVRSRRASSIGPFRVAGVGLGAGLGLFAATQAVRELGERLEVTGQAALTTQGKLRNMVAALTSGNLIGAIDALRRAPQTIEELGISAAIGETRLKALREVAAGFPSVFQNMKGGADAYNEAMARQRQIIAEAGTDNARLAKELLGVRDAGMEAAFMFDLMADSAARMGATFITQTGALVTFKGAVDDLVRAGRGEAVSGVRATGAPFQPGGPITAAEQRNIDLIGKQGVSRIPLLRSQLADLNAQLNNGTVSTATRLRLLTDIKSTEAEIAGIYASQADSRRAAGEAAAREAKAAREAAARRAEEARRALALRQETAAFRLLGLGPGGGELAPGLDALRNRFARTLGDVGSRKLPDSMKKLVAGIRKLLVPGVKGVTEEVRQAIEDSLVKLDEFLDRRQQRRPRYRVVSTEQVLAGLGLSPQELRMLNARLSGVDRLGRVPSGGQSAFGYSLPGGTTVNLYGDMNVTADNPDAIVRYLQNRARKTATQTRGSRAGSRQSIDG